MIDLLGVIANGISIVNGVTTLLRNLEGSSHSPISHSVSCIQRRVASVDRAMNQSGLAHRNSAAVSRAYMILTKAIAADPHYSVYLEVRPTSHGTLRIVRRRKKSILRDPKGEYGPVGGKYCG